MASFKFEKISTFWQTVKVMRPEGLEQEFEAQFVYLDDKEWAEAGKVNQSEFLKKHWVGWKGIVDGDDKEMQFSDPHRDQLLEHSYVTLAVIAAYIAGRQGLRAKN